MNSATELIALLRQLQILKPAQLDDLARKIEGKQIDARTVAQKLIEAGWLTPYQVNQLLQGRGPALLLGSYIMLERLGEGGMGEVFKAKHKHLDRTVALKLIHKERVDNPQAVKRFRREIEAAAKLNHPNIVLAYDADQIENKHFFTMEFIEGTDLNKLVKEKGPLPVEQACDYMRQAALGLQHAVERNLVHRDIKPHNLLVSKTGTVKILDMGLARMQADDDSSTLTKEGSVMGTLDYVSPEQAMNAHTVDIRADLYSLGCTFYFLLTGRVPFPGGTAMEKLSNHAFHEPAPVEQLRPDVPPGVAAVVRKLMAKKPEERFQTPAEVAAVLAKGALVPTGAIQSSPRRAAIAATPSVGMTAPLAVPVEADETIAAGTTPPEAGLGRKKRPWLLLLAGGGGFCLFGVAVLSLAFFMRSEDGRDSKGKVTTTVAAKLERPALLAAPFDEKTAKDYQKRWGAYLGRQVVETNSIKIELVLVPPGKYLMGSPDNEAGREGDGREGPVHEVTISEPFYIGKVEVTVGEFRQFVEAGNKPQGGDEWKTRWPEQTDRHPVVQVSAIDAENFCAWLSKKEGQKYTLPTEAQWEYACRAGSQTKFCFGDDDKMLGDYCWYNANSGGKTQATGQKRPNAWGLHDMHGNVWEWVADPFDKDFYKKTSPKVTDPLASAGATRVLRGGSWYDDVRICRAAYRLGGGGPPARAYNVGFRVVVLPPFGRVRP
jgi:formylglycine-generating enzyme required for sulfatase activity/tRNA A-37 threonylcarbamoyl transferase component Bud32